MESSLEYNGYCGGVSIGGKRCQLPVVFALVS